MEKTKTALAWIGFFVVLWCTLYGALNLLNDAYVGSKALRVTEKVKP